ncbi:MAG TPA: hypothetical protein VI756_14355 [Blastocatellia bacterium]
MVKALRVVPDDRVRAYIIWLPIFGGDFQGEAGKLSNSFQDNRVSYYLDPDSETARAWQPVLKTPFPAWDVYMLYGPDAGWRNPAPQPDFWMQQLGHVTGAPQLNGETFTAKLKSMVTELKAKSNVSRTSGTLRVELLYFRSCPVYHQALMNLKAALKEAGMRAKISMVDVRTENQAEQLGFQGSPSIRINGKDMDGRDQGYVYGCRIYQIDGKVTPTPTKDFIERRLKEMLDHRSQTF